ncbi:hypothetical protein K438DRAFT_1978845 [Mycena galopus ATCC 62051]|nr:hypothetical protein K438DRAFT_1978845 [Mycena galopus ATCC 62051]
MTKRLVGNILKFLAIPHRPLRYIDTLETRTSKRLLAQRNRTLVFSCSLFVPRPLVFASHRAPVTAYGTPPPPRVHGAAPQLPTSPLKQMWRRSRNASKDATLAQTPHTLSPEHVTPRAEVKQGRGASFGPPPRVGLHSPFSSAHDHTTLGQGEEKKPIHQAERAEDFSPFGLLFSSPQREGK